MTVSNWDVAKSHFLIAAALAGLGAVGSGNWVIGLYVFAGLFFISSVLLATVSRYLPKRFHRILLSFALPNLRMFLALVALGLACIIRGETSFWDTLGAVLIVVAYVVLLYDMYRATGQPKAKE